MLKRYELSITVLTTVVLCMGFFWGFVTFQFSPIYAQLEELRQGQQLLIESHARFRGGVYSDLSKIESDLEKIKNDMIYIQDDLISLNKQTAEIEKRLDRLDRLNRRKW